MDDLFNADPASYPKTNTAEIESVSTLVYILDKNLIKVDAKFLDKIPNTDGLIEIVTPEQVPIGKLEIQIKTLDQNNLANPKYQCAENFLSFCEKSILPVLLVAVDAAAAKAYWRYMSRDYLQSIAKLMKGKSINVDLPIENIIQKSNSYYVDEWVKIIFSRLKRVIDYDSIAEELEQLKIKHNELMKSISLEEGVTDDQVAEIQRFLDYYNDLLDNDFKIVKDVYYARAWKIGIAYSNYSPTTLNFSLFEIYYGHNLPQIQKLSGKGMAAHNSFDNVSSHNGANDIKSNPVDYAYQLIVSDLKKIVNNYTILYLDSYLAREYIISFIDKFGFLLNLKGNEQNYNLADVKERFQRYLPLLLEAQYGGLDNINSDQIIHVDIKSLEYRPTPFILKLMPVIEQRFQDGLSAKHKFMFILKEVSSTYIWNLLLHLEREHIQSIERLYYLKAKPRKEIFFKWEVYTKVQVRSMLTMIYENLPNIYNSFILEYFPKIKEHISYFNSFNRLIIVVKMNENAADFTDGPILEQYYLSNIFNPHEQRVDVYVDGIDHLPIERKNMGNYRVGHESLKLNDNEYNLKKALQGRLKNLYNSNPMLDCLYDALKDRLEIYLKQHYKQTGSVFGYRP